MVRRDPNKPRGRVSGYAFFVRACRQQHKRKHPKQPIVFSQFSKQCAEKWRVRNVCELQIEWNFCAKAFLLENHHYKTI